VSYWVYLEEDNTPVSVETFSEGGTLAIGGTVVAELNVTYNYAEVFGIFKWSVRYLHEKKAADTLEILEYLASVLPNRPWQDYWAPTPGNAGAVVHRLLSWAKQNPYATWRVS
jgi:hypothetical protein